LRPHLISRVNHRGHLLPLAFSLIALAFSLIECGAAGKIALSQQNGQRHAEYEADNFASSKHTTFRFLICVGYKGNAVTVIDEVGAADGSRKCERRNEETQLARDITAEKAACGKRILKRQALEFR
jgi:hypothetical protein